MKTIFVLLSLIGTFAMAGSVECNKGFATDIKSCGRSVRTIPGKLKADALKVCIAGAQADRVACDSAPNMCLDNCTNSYNASINYCKTTFDITQCLGDATCEAQKTAQQQACFDAANTNYASCVAGCP
jgi:hypothetical protein